ncbi:MAG: phytanoyl-CoA dioxygenase family protein [Actinomycetales bacterium]|nr:phytanoyl-CoA dioxygenase family protein [Actinomycetales bacterium]
MIQETLPGVPAWLDPMQIDVGEVSRICSQRTTRSQYPQASDVALGILIYDAGTFPAVTSPQAKSLQAELTHALLDGPGIVVLAGAFADTTVIDRASALFETIIADQHASGAAAGDHFAKAGANDRIWNSLEKHALSDPDSFIDYYANEPIALICQAWLGPGYQVTAQVNVVNPGGQAQVPHRDYHLGFMSNEQAEQYPGHVHRLSPVLTLQGAIAHCDMPLETGPTMYLPHSQKLVDGYLAWRDPQVAEYVRTNCVQVPLNKGDAVFFNPAVLHGAGTNTSANVRRMANLLQVSSAFGRAMEAVDRASICRAIFPRLRERASADLTAERLACVIAASAEGYPFPTNLDRDQPIGGLAPASQAVLLSQAVTESWPTDRLDAALQAYDERRMTR